MKHPVHIHSFFSDYDINLFKAGKHYRLYNKLGAHITEVNGEKGVYFAVWAPSAKSVSVIGDFNYWTDGDHKLYVRWDGSGIWEGFIPKVEKGAKYKYKIQSHLDGNSYEKSDPYALKCEHPPNTASVVWDLEYKWNDQSFLKTRPETNKLDKACSVYEVHLSSWRRNTAENRFLTYEEMAVELVAYVKEMNFTHVEFMPVMEYPYDPSWGYQITGYFAPTSRFGDPQGLMHLIDEFHRAGIGVILDWVPSHFPEDAHGLGNFDGSNLYEHPDPRRGYHPDWKSLIFNYGRNEVRSFLISNAAFWMEKYHVDGLRVDAVASMLYLDYSREEGEWEPNQFGGRENLEAISLLKELNVELYSSFEGIQTIAEESTSFTGVSKPVFAGGLGFGMKWMMGWMHDTLEYFKKDSIYRKFHQNEISFSLTYAFSENFTLPLSHDEVVHGKNSLLSKMPGDEWQKFANLRLLYAYMYTHPGTKLLFMGAEIGQYKEWDFDHSLDWHLLDQNFHKGIQNLVKSLNKIYRDEPALHQKQFQSEGFEWISYGDSDNSVLGYLRKGEDFKDDLLVVANFTPGLLRDYKLGFPVSGKLKEIFNSDASEFGGSGSANSNVIKTEKIPSHGRDFSVNINIPPLGLVIFKIS